MLRIKRTRPPLEGTPLIEYDYLVGGCGGGVNGPVRVLSVFVSLQMKRPGDDVISRRRSE